VNTAAVAGRYSFETWEEYVEKRWDHTQQHAGLLIRTAEVTEKLNINIQFLPSRISYVQPLLRLENEHERAAAWQAVIA
jgi:hypothetical protein